jgi:hypothetical protein
LQGKFWQISALLTEKQSSGSAFMGDFKSGRIMTKKLISNGPKTLRVFVLLQKF